MTTTAAAYKTVAHKIRAPLLQEVAVRLQASLPIPRGLSLLHLQLQRLFDIFFDFFGSKHTFVPTLHARTEAKAGDAHHTNQA